LALIFVVAIGLLLYSIVGLAGTNLLNTANLQNERALEYAADGAVDGAIQTIRYDTPMVTNSTCSPTAPAFAPGTINGVGNVVVFCQSANPSYDRQVTFVACASGTASFLSCASLGTSLLQAQVLYSDVANGCLNPGAPGCYNPPTTSGSSLTVLSWVVAKANG
jgi:hypothetical protein